MRSHIPPRRDRRDPRAQASRPLHRQPEILRSGTHPDAHQLAVMSGTAAAGQPAAAESVSPRSPCGRGRRIGQFIGYAITLAIIFAAAVWA